MAAVAAEMSGFLVDFNRNQIAFQNINAAMITAECSLVCH